MPRLKGSQRFTHPRNKAGGRNKQTGQCPVTSPSFQSQTHKLLGMNKSSSPKPRVIGLITGLVFALSACSSQIQTERDDKVLGDTPLNSVQVLPEDSGNKKSPWNSQFPQGVFSIEPGYIDFDSDSLQRALTYFDPQEDRDGTSLDYTYVFNGYEWLEKESRNSQESNRDRDKTILYLWKSPEVKVFTSGRTQLQLNFRFYTPEGITQGFCRGMIIEVAGRSITLPPLIPCDSPNPLQDRNIHEYYFWDVDNQRDNHILRILATNSFVIRLMDENGIEHVFDFELASSIAANQDCDGWSCRLTAHDLFTLGLQTNRAIELGMGY